MSYVHKINKSRSLFKKFLEPEWDISVISDYSDEEIEEHGIHVKNEISS